eukprot:scaffold23547_cov59-Cyclotella_meneghiniana.AAC.4
MPMHKTAAALFLLTAAATTNATNNSGCYPAWTSGSSYSLGSRVSSTIVINATNYHRHQELRMQSRRNIRFIALFAIRSLHYRTSLCGLDRFGGM